MTEKRNEGNKERRNIARPKEGMKAKGTRSSEKK
jgi:hypothetical protein